MTVLILLSFALFFCNGKLKKPVETKKENWYADLIFKDKSFIFEFIRAIGYSCTGGADIGECISTARSIRDGDIQSWYDEWLKTGDRLYDLAEKMERSGDVISSREAYFRASNYYRAAGFYMCSKTDMAKSLKSWGKSRESFKKAIRTLPDIESVSIPYEKTVLPGYFIKAENTGKQLPLLIVHTGFDGTGEELYFEVGKACKERGYNCLIFEGPGQGEVIRQQKLPYRYDWEKVVEPVIDYALTRSDVDSNNIALMGISMGGYLAPRAAAFEPRLRACIANGGVFSISENMLKSFPKEVSELLNKDPEKFNSVMEDQMKEDITTKWFFENGMWTFQAKSPADLMQKLKKYTLKDVVKQIKCDMLVIDAEDDMFFKDQPRELYDALDCPKDYILFTGEQTAQAHCQMGAIAISNEVIFNWLDKVFREPFSDDIRKRLERTVKKNLAECQDIKNIPGAVAGVWIPGRGIWTKAFGKSDLAGDRDMSLDDKFRIGSNTKTFVVTVVLQLADEGKLRLDDTLDKFDLGLNIPDENKITLRQLCNMTSGIPEFSKNDELCEEFYVKNPLKKWIPADIVKTALTMPPTFPPGGGWYYSNTGYILLGMVIEKVSGDTVDDQIGKRILKPMGLSNTSFPTDYPGMPSPYAHGYELDDNKKWQDATVYSPSLLWSAGAMISDMRDMKRWVKAYTVGTTNSKAAQKERLTWVDTPKGKDLKFGLGIGNTNGWIGYTGGTRGYNTAAYYLPEADATIIVFVNSTDYSKNDVSIANKIVHDITKILFPDKVAW
ncbi:MAG: alpha/beta fold hydrolase [Candidatus Omnitrophota bacterium]